MVRDTDMQKNAGELLKQKYDDNHLEQKYADDLRKLKIFDLHCDTLDALCMQDVEPFKSQLTVGAGGDVAHNDLALAIDRMTKAAPGGWTQCYAVWVPDDLQHTPYTPLEFYRHVRDYFKAQSVQNSCSLAATTDTRSAALSHAWGSVAALLTVENASPLGTDLGVVEEFAADGVKMVTLTWNGQNSLGSGNTTLEGLSSFGKQAIHAFEKNKIIVDVSHLNDAGFRDVLDVAQRPFVATHSNSRVICGHPRNLTDEQFIEIRDRGGLVGITYCPSFIADAPQGKEVSFDQLSFHIDHFLNLDGALTLALGSDFDGCDCPSWIHAAENIPAFYVAVAERFGKDIADRMFYQNAQDFFQKNEQD